MDYDTRRRISDLADSLLDAGSDPPASVLEELRNLIGPQDAAPHTVSLSDNEMAQLASVAEAMLGRAQTEERKNRQSGGKFPPSFIVHALYDDARLIAAVVERAEAGEESHA